MVNIDRSAPKVTVGTATRKTQTSTGTGKLNIPKLPYDLPVKGHIMPGFKHTLIDVGLLCDADCKVTFTRVAVIARDSQVSPVLTGWREQSGPRLWRIALQPGESEGSLGGFTSPVPAELCVFPVAFPTVTLGAERSMFTMGASAEK